MKHAKPLPTPTTPLSGERLLTLSDVSRLLPGRAGAGSRLHSTCLLRRIRDGTVNRHTGVRVYLEAIRDGGRWLTSAEAVARYQAALGPPPAVPPATPRLRAASRRRANAALDAAGI